MVRQDIKERALLLSEYILTGRTIRAAAKEYGISKSTVWMDVSIRLRKIDPNLHDIVKSILEYNWRTKHIRGGIATKLKYKKAG